MCMPDVNEQAQHDLLPAEFSYSCCIIRAVVLICSSSSREMFNCKSMDWPFCLPLFIVPVMVRYLSLMPVLRINELDFACDLPWNVFVCRPSTIPSKSFSKLIDELHRFCFDVGWSIDVRMFTRFLNWRIFNPSPSTLRARFMSMLSLSSFTDGDVRHVDFESVERYLLPSSRNRLISWLDDFFANLSMDDLLTDFIALEPACFFSLVAWFVLVRRSSRLDESGYWRFGGWKLSQMNWMAKLVRMLSANCSPARLRCGRRNFERRSLFSSPVVCVAAQTPVPIPDLVPRPSWWIDYWLLLGSLGMIAKTHQMFSQIKCNINSSVAVQSVFCPNINNSNASPQCRQFILHTQLHGHCTRVRKRQKQNKADEQWLMHEFSPTRRRTCILIITDGTVSAAPIITTFCFLFLAEIVQCAWPHTACNNRQFQNINASATVNVFNNIWHMLNDRSCHFSDEENQMYISSLPKK